MTFRKPTGVRSTPPAENRSGLLLSLVFLIAIFFGVGVILGFIGAGGAGMLTGLLSGVFGLEIGKAIGTALAAMCVVTIFGAISHYRENHVAPRVGSIVGITGVAGAIAGAELAQFVSANTLELGAGLTLWFLALLVWLRTGIVARSVDSGIRDPLGKKQEVLRGVALGGTGGIAAGFFGVGMAPYLQLGFLTGLRLTLVQTIGTTMLTLVFISGAAATVLARHGDVSVHYLVTAVTGLSMGTYLGAKFTERAPWVVLRSAVVLVPIVAGAMVLFL